MKKAIIFPEVEQYLDGVTDQESAKVFAGIRALEAGLMASVKTKPLRGKVRELIVKMHRIVYFGIGPVLYFVDAFLKRSNKTPQRIIKRAGVLYRDIAKHIKT